MILIKYATQQSCHEIKEQLEGRQGCEEKEERKKGLKCGKVERIVEKCRTQLERELDRFSHEPCVSVYRHLMHRYHSSI